MRPKRGKVVGDNLEPKQYVRHDRPTHACFHDDGSVTIVFPEGHDPDRLVRLPNGYSEETHQPDHAGRRFIRRQAPPAAPAPSLEDRVALLEAQMAALLEGEPPAGAGNRTIRND